MDGAVRSLRFRIAWRIHTGRPLHKASPAIILPNSRKFLSIVSQIAQTMNAFFATTMTNSISRDRIELFIDENKALMKRMYGEFDMGSPEYGPGRKRKRSTKPGVPDLHFDPGPDPGGKTGGESFFSHIRNPRQNFRNNQSSESGRVDACESKVEIVTPYWASNSAGKIRAIVNTQHFEQAIHQEVCA